MSSTKPKDIAEKKRLHLPDSDWMVFGIVVFVASGFGVLGLRDGALDPVALALAALIPSALALQAVFLTRYFPYVDKHLFLVAHFLCGIGLIVLYRLSPGLGMRQLAAYALGCAAQWAALVAIYRVKTGAWWKLRWIAMGGSAAFLLLVVAVGYDRLGTANSWIRFAGFSIQPSEFVKIALVLVLALYFSRAKNLRENLPALGFAVICAGALLLQQDLGATLIYFFTAVLMYYVATSDIVLTGLGVLGAAGGAVLSYQMFSHVRVRVAIWQNPWALYDGLGYQIVQSLMAIGSGGLMGLGLGQGLPRTIPVFESDFIFAVICEEFGVVVGLCLLALYAVIIARTCLLAVRCRDDFSALLCFGLAATLTIQTFLIVGGVVNMVPLTGVTLPFISSGGSSMVSCLATTGILLGVSAKEGKAQAAAWRAARDALRERTARQ